MPSSPASGPSPGGTPESYSSVGSPCGMFKPVESPHSTGGGMTRDSHTSSPQLGSDSSSGAQESMVFDLSPNITPRSSTVTSETSRMDTLSSDSASDVHMRDSPIHMTDVINNSRVLVMKPPMQRSLSVPIGTIVPPLVSISSSHLSSSRLSSVSTGNGTVVSSPNSFTPVTEKATTQCKEQLTLPRETSL